MTSTYILSHHEKCDDERAAVAELMSEYEKPASERRFGMLDLIAYTGSRAQGLSTAQSDADIRAVTALTPSKLLTLDDFGTCKMPSGDTVVASMHQFLGVLKRGSATDFEILGQRECDYEYVGWFACELMDNIYKVLSVKYADSCYGFIRQHSVDVKRLSLQLQNDDGIDVSDEQVVSAFRAALDKAQEGTNDRMAHDGLAGRIELVGHDDFTVTVDSDGMLAGDMQNVLDSVKGISKRYSKLFTGTAKQTKRRLDKTLCHMIRTLLTGIEVMEGGGLHTCRTGAEHELLMDIKTGGYTDEHGVISDAYWRLYDKTLVKFETLRQREHDGKGILGSYDGEWLDDFEVRHNLAAMRDEYEIA